MAFLMEPEMALERYGSMVYRLALARTRNSADAEDVFQEVFLRLVRSEPRFENEEHLKAWLIHTAVNCGRSLWKSIARRREEPLPPDGELPAREAEENAGVYYSVMRLPPRYRTVIHLFYYEDMPIEEIGRALRISYSAAAKRLSRARELLKRDLMKGEEYEEFSERIQDGGQSPAHSK
ncbi:sigma-70 family RNA polymerase sigma factor [Caproiciproducens sp. NJN-50]|uniref:RNA polymerase sigma factor n=1 Tax=Acutalibacteraceae TaxID=3082771 RepID=UPI000FFE08D8|nr:MULTISPECIES: sigma-70 family RNA polymerase sigma factor [Acutalibacteraceae]QAT48505.1 sigma-70 family RNA polymerase sigma factor [Caproiciproducens sp. NJN-50]